MADLLREYFMYAVLLFVGIAAGVLACRAKKNTDVPQDILTGGLTEEAFYLRTRSILKRKSDTVTIVSMKLENAVQLSSAFGAEACTRAVNYLFGVLDRQLSGAELFARTGEDTFCFLLKNRKTEEVCARLDRIYDAINRFCIDETESYRLQVVFGVYRSEDKQEDIVSMQTKAVDARITAADHQLYRFYDGSSRERSASGRELAASVDQALKTNEFVVYYQPKVRTFDRKIAGAEALIRWRHPQKGLLSPDMFLKTAELYQKSCEIDLFVAEAVCGTLARWKKQQKELCPISVNLSRASFQRADFADLCHKISRKYDVDPELIEFEVKEELLKDVENAKAAVARFHAFGFRCVVDNFGASDTSLKLLGTLDIDTIKLDSSFFNGENDNRKGRYIVEALLKLATQLHIQTVAEGIDKQGQVQYLHQVACDMIQGFYYFKPMPLETFESQAYSDNVLNYAVHENDLQREGREPKNALGQSVQTAKSIVLFSYLPDEDLIEFSEAFSPVLGTRKQFRNGLALFRTTDLVHENDREDFLRLIERCQRENGWVENTLRFYVSGGRYRWLEVHLRKDGNVISGTMINMAEWKNEVERWKEKATRDALTGLYNREHFEQSVQAQLRQKNFTSAAVLFIDVDDFKRVNDTLGHRFGDDVLCYVAKQILGVFRHSDVIARYGGDEFVVFAPSIEQPILEERLKRLCGAFQFPYRNGELEYKVSGSIGAAVFPRDGSDYATLLEHADCALYEAKNRGKDQFVLYEPYMKGEDCT